MEAVAVRRLGLFAIVIVTIITVTGFIPLGTALQTPYQEPLLAPDSSIEAARLAIDHRQGLVGAQLPAEMSPILEQEQRNLDASEDLIAISDADDEDGLAEAIALAKRGTRHQIATLGSTPAEPLPLEGYETPSAALAELADRHNVTLTKKERAELAELDTLDDPVRTTLTRVVDAFLALDTATRQAYVDADLSQLRELRAEQTKAHLTAGGLQAHPDTPQQTSRPGKALTEAGVDLVPVMATRTQFLDAVQDLSTALEAHPVHTASSCNPTQKAPAYSIALANCDNTYTDEVALQLDAGGTDHYQNNAGGNNLDSANDKCRTVAHVPAAGLVDLGDGDDLLGKATSPRECGANGGGHFGAGFLVNEGGQDTYVAAGLGVNGGGAFGSGFLLDAGGRDDYDGTEGGVNGGGWIGAGFLLDAGHTDTYDATKFGTNGGNGGAGLGFLFDLTGDDTYTATHLGTNGGGSFYPGMGVLIDIAGDDTYTGGGGGTNGGGATGHGFLLDAYGNDAYTAADTGVNGGGYVTGTGALVDLRGYDYYEADGCAVNGGGADPFCSGILVLADDQMAGSGLLVDAGGGDTYDDKVGGNCSDCSHIPKGTVGAQIDSDSVESADP